MQYAILIGVGVAAGLLGGFVGVGGGIIMVPALVMLLGYSQLKAQGTSLGVLCLPVSILGFLQYWKNPELNLDLWAIVAIAAGFLVGGHFGGKWANQLDPLLMRKVFSVFLVCVATYLFFKR